MFAFVNWKSFETFWQNIGNCWKNSRYYLVLLLVVNSHWGFKPIYRRICIYSKLRIVNLLKMCGWFKGLRVLYIGPACITSWQPYHHTKIEITPRYAARRSESHHITLPKDQNHTKLHYSKIKITPSSCFFCTPVIELRAQLISKNFSKDISGLLPPPFLGNPKVAILRFTIYMTQQCQWSCPDTSWQAPDRATVRYTGNPTKTKFTSHNLQLFEWAVLLNWSDS